MRAERRPGDEQEAVLGAPQNREVRLDAGAQSTLPAATGPDRSNALSTAGWTAPNAASTVFGPSRSVPDRPGWNAAPASPIT